MTPTIVRSSRVTKPGQLSAKLLWLTNIPTPYRVPLWDAIADRTSIDVLTLEATEPGRDWIFEEHLDITILGCPRIEGAIETPLYLPTKRLQRAISTSKAAAIVIDGWDSPAYQYALYVARKAGKGVVASFRSTTESHRFNRGPVAWMRKRFLNGVDSIVTGGSASTTTVQAMGVPDERIVTGFNAVDVNFFSASANRYREGQSAFSGHRFVFVGQLLERKNIGAAIEAFAAIRGHDDEFLIVGSGPKERELRDVACEFGVAEQVQFLGHVSPNDLPRIYAQSHTLVLPSINEVWGLVVNEALASGLHAVISTQAGVTESVAKMPGTFPSAASVQDLGRQMAASRSRWKGPIAAPQILSHGIEQSAEAFCSAIDIATRRAWDRNSPVKSNLQ